MSLANQALITVSEENDRRNKVKRKEKAVTSKSSHKGKKSSKSRDHVKEKHTKKAGKKSHGKRSKRKVESESSEEETEDSSESTTSSSEDDDDEEDSEESSEEEEVIVSRKNKKAKATSGGKKKKRSKKSSPFIVDEAEVDSDEDDEEDKPTKKQRGQKRKKSGKKRTKKSSTEESESVSESQSSESEEEKAVKPKKKKKKSSKKSADTDEIMTAAAAVAADMNAVPKPELLTNAMLSALSAGKDQMDGMEEEGELSIDEPKEPTEGEPIPSTSAGLPEPNGEPAANPEEEKQAGEMAEEVAKVLHIYSKHKDFYRCCHDNNSGEFLVKLHKKTKFPCSFPFLIRKIDENKIFIHVYEKNEIIKTIPVKNEFTEFLLNLKWINDFNYHAKFKISSR